MHLAPLKRKEARARFDTYQARFEQQTQTPIIVLICIELH